MIGQGVGVGGRGYSLHQIEKKTNHFSLGIKIPESQPDQSKVCYAGGCLWQRAYGGGG